MPKGTHLTGAVASVHRARWFHRGGQLQFNFQKIDLPQGITRPTPSTPAPEAPVLKTQATLAAAESGGNTAIKVDEEVGVKATEPKTRLIAPLISVLIASRASDHEHDADDIGRASDECAFRSDCTTKARVNSTPSRTVCKHSFIVRHKPGRV